MSVATLSQVLQPAADKGYAVGGLVVLGWEDAVCFVAAGEAAGLPVILQAGPACRRHTPLPVLGPMFRYLAEQATIPVVCHLDHGMTLDEVRLAIDSGFSSVMIDGSRLPLAENIALSAKAAEMAHDADISIEGEIGFVGFHEGDISRPTDPDEAGQLVRQANLDALAISVGSTHLQTQQMAEIDYPLLRAIEAATDAPLVIHGGSGVPAETRRQLAHTSRVCKFNIGTQTRQLFGAGLRQYLADTPDAFDRVQILQAQMPALRAAAIEIIENIGPPRV